MRYLTALTLNLWTVSALAQADWNVDYAQQPEPSAPVAAAAADEVTNGGDDDWGDVEEMEEVTTYTEEDTWFTDSYANLDRSFNLHSAKATRPGALLFAVYHRPNSALRDDTFYNYLGFDGGQLKVGLMFRYGILRGVDAGFMRVNGTVEQFDTYEFDTKVQVLHQEKYEDCIFGCDMFIDAAVRLGGTWFAQDKNHAFKPFGQLIVDRVFWNRLKVGMLLMIHGDSSGPEKAGRDPDTSLAGGMFFHVRFTGKLAWDFEISQTLAGYGAKFPAITTGLKMVTNRHTFGIVLSNTQYFSADGIVANTPRLLKDLILGFNITRELDLL